MTTEMFHTHTLPRGGHRAVTENLGGSEERLRNSSHWTAQKRRIHNNDVSGPLSPSLIKPAGHYTRRFFCDTETQQPAVRCANMKTVLAGERGTGDGLSLKHLEVGLGDLAALEAEQSFPLTSSLHVPHAPDQAKRVMMCDWTVTAISPRPSASLIHTFQVQLKWHVL